jgi:cyclic dehypoxanthinyl futalosine synthase
MNELSDKIYARERISEKEALELFTWDILELGMAADFRTRQAEPAGTVGFIIDRIINFTNICEAECSFCAFHARAGHIAPYELTIGEILRRVDELVNNGGTQVMLQGGMHPRHTLDTYIGMVREIKSRFPGVILHSFSPAELAHAVRCSGVTIDHAVGALKDAGLDSVPGASDILVERVRRLVSPKKIGVAEWLEVMESLARHGMKSSATMTYGLGETLPERVEHLAVIRDLQDRTGIIRAFIPWSFSPANTRLADVPPATGLDYLRVVSVGRIFLDNVRYIQAGWLTEGMKLAQIALTMGANDMGGVLTEEVVVGATGVKNKTNMDEMIDVIRDAGRIPIQRDSDYQQIRSFA